MQARHRPRASFSEIFVALLSCLALSLPAPVLCSRAPFPFHPFGFPSSRFSSSLDETLKVYKPTCLSLMPRGVSPSDYRFITLLSYLTSLSLLPPSLSLSLLSSLYSFNPTLGSHTIYLRTPSALTSCLASVSPQQALFLALLSITTDGNLTFGSSSLIHNFWNLWKHTIL